MRIILSILLLSVCYSSECNPSHPNCWACCYGNEGGAYPGGCNICLNVRTTNADPSVTTSTTCEEFNGIYYAASQQNCDMSSTPFECPVDANCNDCTGTPWGDAEIDVCGECGGDGIGIIETNIDSAHYTGNNIYLTFSAPIDISQFLIVESYDSLKLLNQSSSGIKINGGSYDFWYDMQSNTISFITNVTTMPEPDGTGEGIQLNPTNELDIFNLTLENGCILNQTINFDYIANDIKVVPNPSTELMESMNKIRFTHLPEVCTIEIYSTHSDILDIIDHNDAFDSNEFWEITQGSGIYIYIIKMDLYDFFGDFLTTAIISEGSIVNTLFQDCAGIWSGDLVEDNCGVCDGDGSSCDGTLLVPSEYSTIQSAIDAASNGDSVLVSAGTYVENIVWAATNGIKLIGSGEQDCIIDGDSLASVIRFEQDLGGIIDSTTLITGFTIQNGYALAAATGGGGMFLYDANPTLTDVIISGNMADPHGGAMYLDNSNPTLNHVTISGNFAPSGFYGIFLSDSSGFTMTNSILWPDGLGSSVYNSYNFSTINYSNITHAVGGEIMEGEGNINLDPLFCDADNGDFTLAENSPCIGTGQDGANIGALGVGDCGELSAQDDPLPSKYSISSIYPNPFNPTTTISFSIPQFGLTTIRAYDITGRQLETLTNEVLSVGSYSINWNASDCPSGVYLIRMESEDFTQTQKVVLVK